MHNVERKPDWLKKKIFFTDSKQQLQNWFKEAAINTICESARCPNKSECFNDQTASFLLMGNLCTRNCRFCSVPSASYTMIKEKKIPLPDPNEPLKIANLVKKMNLKYVVLTSVDRDDLEDLGVTHFIKTIQSIRLLNSEVNIEVLTPDFQGEISIIRKLVEINPEVYNHNMETVQRLSPKVRKKSDYFVSLSVLEKVKEINPNAITKTGVMLGLGETEKDLKELFKDIHTTRCDILVIGQYLQPSSKNIAVQEFIHPERFKIYQEEALSIGIPVVYSGPFVRSSYKSIESYEKILELRKK